MALKLNLGSERVLLGNFENLDNRPFPGVKLWSWNTPLPYSDNSAELVLVQHSLMYVASQNYDQNLQEIYRVLCDKGILLLKEEDNRRYQWRKLGTKHKTGHIIGSTNPVDIVPVLERNKFKIINTDPHIIIDKYDKDGKFINRLPKLFKGKLFIVECEKVV